MRVGGVFWQLTLALVWRQFRTRRASLLRHRVDMAVDEKIPDAATFTLKREDHTLGNMLRM